MSEAAPDYELLLLGDGAAAFADKVAAVVGQSGRPLTAAAVYFDRARRSETPLSTIDGLVDAGVSWGWFLPGQRRLGDFAFAAFDMDSTLISIECIDEIADFVGKKQAIAAVTEAAMRGECDYTTSLHQRLALLAGVEARVLARVYGERLLLSEGVRPLIDALQAAGCRTAIVSGGFTYFTERLRIELGFDFATSNELELAGGKLTGRVIGEVIDAAAKAAHVKRLLAACDIARERSIVCGDGGNDLLMLQAAGLSLAFHGKPALLPHVDVAINAGGIDQLLTLWQLLPER